jgi:hypothetical protein
VNIKKIFIAFAVLLGISVNVSASSPENYLIRTYNIEIAVESLEAALPKILALPGIDIHSSLDIQAGNGRMERIVSNRELDRTLNLLQGMAQVHETNSNARSEFAQLSSLQSEFLIRNMEYRNLNELLLSAGTLADFRIIESRLVSLISEIESLRGRINFLNSEIGTTQINIGITTIPPTPIEEPEPTPEEQTPLQRISNTFIRSATATLATAQNLLVSIAYASIPLVGILIFAFGNWRIVRWFEMKNRKKLEGGVQNEK